VHINSKTAYCFKPASNFLFLIAFSKPFLDNDYYYGGSMRDLSSRHTGRRKSSSASHIGESFRNNLARCPARPEMLALGLFGDAPKDSSSKERQLVECASKSIVR